MYLNVQYVFVNFANTKILYNGKLSREKTFTNFVVLWLFAKVFSAKFGGVVSFGAARASNPRKSSFSPIHSLESFPVYVKNIVLDLALNVRPFLAYTTDHTGISMS